MHAPAGGRGRHAACPQCSSPQSLQVQGEELRRPNGGAVANSGAAAAYRHNKELRQAAHPNHTGGRQQASAAQVRSRVSAAAATATAQAAVSGRATDCRAPAPSSEADGNRTGASAGSASSGTGGQQRIGGNTPAAAAAGTRGRNKPRRNSVDDGNDAYNGGDGGGGGRGGDGGGGNRSERSSVTAGGGEAGVCGTMCGTIELGRAGSSGTECLREIEAEAGAGVALMRRNHAALLRVIREQEDRGKQVRDIGREGTLCVIFSCFSQVTSYKSACSLLMLVGLSPRGSYTREAVPSLP